MPPLELQEGCVLDGTYRIVRRIGRGGMGIVYEAVHVRTQRRVALKVLHERLVTRGEFVERFWREAVIGGQLGHPNIVGILDFNRTDGGIAYLAMEYVEGRSLGELLRASGRLPIEQALDVIWQIGEALGAAHAAGVVHRDLKPDNVLLLDGPGLHVKVLDFGLATMKHVSWRALTSAGQALGTPRYMSPEQALGDAREVGARADQFAFGVIAYRMLTGCHAFDGDDTREVLHQTLYETPKPPSQLRPDLPPGLDAVILRALAKSPADRYPNVLAFTRQIMRVTSRTPRAVSVIPTPGGGVASAEAAITTPAPSDVALPPPGAVAIAVAAPPPVENIPPTAPPPVEPMTCVHTAPTRPLRAVPSASRSG